MYFLTQALVLSAIKYGENSRVLRCYTREFGLQAYMLNSVSSKKGVIKAGMILPLTQLELVVTHKGKGTLERIKEAKVLNGYNQVHTNPVRNALALFVAELLTKSLKEETPNADKFDYIISQCVELDDGATSLAQFHINFMLGLSRYLGFAPDGSMAREASYFDLMEGTFMPLQPLHPHYMDQQTTEALLFLLDKPDAQISKAIRKKLLYDLLQYYRIHVEDFGQLKSLEVLEELFAD